MTRIMRYILPHDTGMAPCIDDGLVSLATCKPVIRRTALRGDWVLGFRPSPAPHGLLIWAAQVAEVVPIEAYEPRFRGRMDAVYRPDGSGGFKRLRPEYHPTAAQLHKDVSAPVLVFKPQSTWYFGSDPKMLPEQLLHLSARGVGHRVNGVREGDAVTLERWLRENWQPGVQGPPHDPAPPASSMRSSCGAKQFGARC